MRDRWLATVLAACLWSGAACAAELRLDADGFTADLKQMIQEAMPGASIEVSAPLSLSLKIPGKDSMGIYLDRIYDYCRRMAGDCRDQVATYVRVTAQSFQPEPAIDASMLRAVLRPKSYVDDTRSLVTDKPAEFVLARPFAGELYEMCVIDRPDTAALLNADMIKTLALTPDAAFARCESNIAASETMPAVPSPDGRHIAIEGGDYYYSSLILLHDAWKPLAAKLGGTLLVAVPDPNSLLYSDSDDPQNIAMLAKIAAEGMRLSERPLFGQIFRWTQTGWELVTP